VASASDCDPGWVILFAPVYRFACHLLKFHGRADETFPAVADVLAIGCLLAIFVARLPRIKTAWALAMVATVALVPVYVGAVHFRTTAILLLVLWPLLHFSIAGLCCTWCRPLTGYLT
jgi:hypothetical protein